MGMGKANRLNGKLMGMSVGNVISVSRRGRLAAVRLTHLDHMIT